MADEIIDDPVSRKRGERIQKELASFQEMEILIGWQGPTGDEDAGGGASVAQVAAFNEFGTSTIPARPALRTGIDEARDAIAKGFEEELGAILDDKRTAIVAANRLGLRGVAAVRSRIKNSPSWAVPNAPSTIEAKGSDVPLIDSAQMLQAVTFQVRKGDAVVSTGGA